MIEASASPSDDVVCFARLYREVTEGVGAELAREGFADARFLETLDIRFAGLFFSALESYDRDALGVGSVVRAALTPRHCSAAVRARRDERPHQS
jgi:hypothetical protein